MRELSANTGGAGGLHTRRRAQTECEPVCRESRQRQRWLLVAEVMVLVYVVLVYVVLVLGSTGVVVWVVVVVVVAVHELLVGLVACLLVFNACVWAAPWGLVLVAHLLLLWHH